MRSIILTLTLALALPLIPTTADATAHSCNQLRQTVFNQAPPTTRNLPYGALNCHGVSQIHLLLTTSGHRNQSFLIARIEAVFRNQGVIR